jgi:hypothetical protein
MHNPTLTQPDAPGAAAPPTAAAETRPMRVRGNLSLWLLAGGYALFRLWRWHSGLPATAGVRPLGGLLDFSVGQLDAFFNFLLGWLGLTAILSRGNFRQVLVHFFAPLRLIDDPELRRFFVAPATFIFSAGVFAFAIIVAGSTWVVRVNTEYEVIAQLPPGTNARLLSAAGTDATKLRLTAGSPVRLLLGPPGHTVMTILRDKYGLRTLDAFMLRRGVLGYSIEQCDLVPVNSATPTPVAGPGDGIVRTDPRGLAIVGPLRWSDQRVGTPLTLVDGRHSDRGWLRAGDGHDGPERGAPPWAQRYLERLYQERDAVAAWSGSPAYDGAGGRVVSVSVNGYDLTVAFEEMLIACPGSAPLRSREAVRIAAVEIQN